MPQLKCDEWPDDGEPTTAEAEVPITEAEAAAVAQYAFRAMTRTEAGTPLIDE